MQAHPISNYYGSLVATQSGLETADSGQRTVDSLVAVPPQSSLRSLCLPFRAAALTLLQNINKVAFVISLFGFFPKLQPLKMNPTRLGS